MIRIPLFALHLFHLQIKMVIHKIRSFWYWGALVIMMVMPSSSYPKSKDSKGSTLYDQKQNGDYNIQLHLKDFQIIAMVADDSLGGLGVSNW